MEGEGAQGPAFVYSQFYTLEGIRIFASVLEAHGFEPLPYGEINSSNIAKYANMYSVHLNSDPELWEEDEVLSLQSLFDEDGDLYDKFVKSYKLLETNVKRADYLQSIIKNQNKDISNFSSIISKTKRYAIYSGAEDPKDRNKILRILQDPLNSHGEICKVFMGTAAAAEGLSLKNFRQVHIFEPFWNEVRIRQVIGRARRICSHSGLPKLEQNVYVYRYHMVLSEKQKTELGENESTDEAIYRIAKTKEKINSQFLQILKDAAVDCVLFAYHNVTADNPIACFSFDDKETGIAYYPNLKEEKNDNLFSIDYHQEAVKYAVFNTFGEINNAYYDDGDYLYVYKYAGDATIIKKERIQLNSESKTIYTATVLYDRILAQHGNEFIPRVALVETKKKGSLTNEKIIVVLPSERFTLLPPV